MMIGVEFLDSEDVLEVYSQDASRWYKVKPLGVFFPKNEEDVVKCVEFCAKRGVPITPRGGGSGLSGGAVPEKNGIVISTEKMKSFLIEDGFAIAYSGAITGEIEKEAKKFGYTIPFQPSSLNFSTIGGNIAADCAGLRSVKYGSARDHIEEIEVVTPTGKIIKLKDSLSMMFAGSEGTLGIITKVKIRLSKLKKRKALIFSFSSVKDAIGFSKEVRRFNPSAIEFIDEKSGEVMKIDENEETPKKIKSYIIVEIEEDEKGYIDFSEQEIIIMAKSFSGKKIDVPDIWERRKKLGPALSKIKPFKMNEDVVLPLSKVERFLEFAEDIDKKRINCLVFGHIGVGILHTNLMFGGGEEKEAEKAKSDLFYFVIENGGAITGEHGTGLEKINFLEKELGENTLEFMWELKSKLDPHNIMNPSKIPMPKRGCIDTLMSLTKPEYNTKSNNAL